MKAVICSSETSVLTSATRRNIPKDAILHSHRSENLISYRTKLYVDFIKCKYSSAIINLGSRPRWGVSQQQCSFGSRKCLGAGWSLVLDYSKISCPNCTPAPRMSGPERRLTHSNAHWLLLAVRTLTARKAANECRRTRRINADTYHHSEYNTSPDLM
jgi:hypothetical protein